MNAESINNIDLEKIKNPGELFNILVEIMDILRSEKGCVWDREQSHLSIKKNIIEEAYEVVESIENNQYQQLKEELGDILLQVVFHSQIAYEVKSFDISSVIKSIIRKLIRRHPHVFSNINVSSSKEVLLNWEDIKKQERKANKLEDTSIFSNIPKILPALYYAHEIQSRAARLGFDWDEIKGVVQKIKEEITELDEVFCIKKALKTSKKNLLMNEIGDLLFSIVNLSRHFDLDSEECLKASCKKFIKRFDFMEDYAAKKGINFANIPLDEKEMLWEMAKNHLG